MVKVDLKDKNVQNLLKHRGIKWRLRDYDNGFELDDDVAVELGLASKPQPSGPKPSKKD